MVYFEDIREDAMSLIRSLDAAVPIQGAAICRHCGKPIVFKPFFLDGKLPNPPKWLHPPYNIETCNTRPKGWRRDSWPCAEPVIEGKTT